MSRQTQADKQKRHWYRPSSIAAWPCRKHPGPLTSQYIIRYTSYGKSMQECREKTGHYDDNMPITHIGIIMITLTRTPWPESSCALNILKFILFTRNFYLWLMSHYPEILRNTSWQNCALPKTLIEIQIKLLFKALRRGPVCQFKPHKAYVQNFK